jgi:DNA-binding CsgD family transcriptional regulator
MQEEQELTNGQKSYLRYSLKGISDLKIAKKMGMSYPALCTLVISTKNTLGLSTKRELMAYARQHV